MLETTGVDGVMIGRAALGNPWMLYRTVKYLESGILCPEPSAKEKVDVCLFHFDQLFKLKGEHLAVLEMRKHAAWYVKGLRGGNEVRKRINVCERADEIRSILRDFSRASEAASVV